MIYNAMEKPLLTSQGKNDQRTYNNIWNILTGPRDDCTTVWLLDCLLC